MLALRQSTPHLPSPRALWMPPAPSTVAVRFPCNRRWCLRQQSRRHVSKNRTSDRVSSVKWSSRNRYTACILVLVVTRVGAHLAQFGRRAGQPDPYFAEGHARQKRRRILLLCCVQSVYTKERRYNNLYLYLYLFRPCREREGIIRHRLEWMTPTMWFLRNRCCILP